MSALAVNIPSDLKNKYGAMVQLVIEASGNEHIGLKDLAEGRLWAYKSMMSWSSKKRNLCNWTTIIHYSVSRNV